MQLQSGVGTIYTLSLPSSIPDNIQHEFISISESGANNLETSSINKESTGGVDELLITEYLRREPKLLESSTVLNRELIKEERKINETYIIKEDSSNSEMMKYEGLEDST